jgi:hypothetical protein
MSLMVSLMMSLVMSLKVFHLYRHTKDSNFKSCCLLESRVERDEAEVGTQGAER